jgi:hydroxymethylglutaryl-CoA lyase
VTLPASVEIVEVGPRDGLQDEPTVVSTDHKLAYIEAVVRAGVRRVEAVSFASPKRVPQMADADAVLDGLRNAGVSVIGLVLNDQGMDRAIAGAVDEVNVVVIASDTFSERNQGMDTAAALAMGQRVTERARAHSMRAGVTISAAFGCPFEGLVPSDRVVQLAVGAASAGATEISLADTIGCAVPTQTEDLVAAVAAATRLPVRVHLHNSRNTGLANAVAALLGGATALDASTGGIGGCPFAPGATGNIATEDLAHMLARMGIATGLDLVLLLEAVELLEGILGRPIPGMLAKAGIFPRP